MRKSVAVLAMLMSSLAASAQVFDYVMITNDVQDAGTNAKVTLTLVCNGNTMEEPLGSGFERGSWNHGTIALSNSGFNCVDSIAVRHDNSGGSPDWNLGAIALKNRSTGAVAVFIYDTWIASNRAGYSLSKGMKRSAFGWKLYKAPYGESWCDKAALPPATTKAVASANKKTGGVAFYCDAVVGGSNATVEVGPSYNAPAAGKVFVRTDMVYTGGLVNAFLASFSELNCSWHFNSKSGLIAMQPAFTGQTVFDKVIGVASVVSGLGVLGTGTVSQVVEAVSTCNDLLGFVNGLQSLADAGNAKSYSTFFVFDGQSGNNRFMIGFKALTTGAATGSSVAIVCGAVKSIEVVGGIPAVESVPPPPVIHEQSGMPAGGSGVNSLTIKPK